MGKRFNDSECVFDGSDLSDRMEGDIIGDFEITLSRQQNRDEPNAAIQQISVGKKKLPCESSSKRVKDKESELLRKHGYHTAVFTDVWCPGVNERNLSNEELFQGELSAVTFKVGCYIVRSSQRIYRICDSDDSLEPEKPAGKNEVDAIRKDLELGIRERQYNTAYGIEYPIWDDKYHITHEISARHISHPGDKFTCICRAAEARDCSWYEYIGDIYAVKENDLIPDEHSFLLIYMCRAGSSFSGDIWYRFDHNGKIAVFGTEDMVS